MQPRRVLILSLSVLALGPVLALDGGAAADTVTPPPKDESGNPCLGANAGHLRCPDLQMRPPHDLYLERTPRGRSLLHATSAIKSRGLGPLELHGKRVGPREMRVTQRIYRTGMKPWDVPTKGRLYFFFIPGQGRYWKFTDAAAFQLWSLHRDGRPKRMVRTGPKTHYCFRDLVRTSRVARSPQSRVYPGCSQYEHQRRVMLGTSVGWSDVYPATYYEQWIDVTGLRGCFWYVLVADPKQRLFESHEENNEAHTTVRLPYKGGPTRCPS